MRNLPSVSELEKMVNDQVAVHTTAKDEFTAYTITLELRTKFPDIEIEHREVRQMVLNAMLLNNDYTVMVKNYNGEDANTYVPVTMANNPAVATIATPGVIANTPSTSNPLSNLVNAIVGKKIDWDDDDTIS